MINIFTNDHTEEILQAAKSIEGLSQAIQVMPLKEIEENSLHLIIDDNQIKLPIPWEGTEPPILIDEIAFDKHDLLALILAKLGYEEEAFQFVKNIKVQTFITSRHRLKGNEETIATPSYDGDDYFSIHNSAVLAYYADSSQNQSSTRAHFQEAIRKAPSAEHAAFTAKHLTISLLDTGENEAASQLLQQHHDLALSEKGRQFLQLDLINVLMNIAMNAYHNGDMKDLKEMIWHSINYFENTHFNWVVADLYIKASEITNIEKSYTESLNYISKAITIYEEEGLPEFLASAYLRKGTLLYTWAQDANPQFFQPAIDTYQEALRVFTREHFPHIFAEIHHNLAVIYAEMPVEEKKRGMWSAFSATSFKECLEFYQKETYPFEYAMVANNYGNALLKYPPAKTGDNSEKAVHYYLEALEIRNAENFPLERAHTILNYLEACWQVHNINKTMERARYKDMLAKAKEISKLTDNQALIEQSNDHLKQLSALSLAITNG